MWDNNYDITVSNRHTVCPWLHHYILCTMYQYCIMILDDNVIWLEQTTGFEYMFLWLSITIAYFSTDDFMSVTTPRLPSGRYVSSLYMLFYTPLSSSWMTLSFCYSNSKSSGAVIDSAILDTIQVIQPEMSETDNDLYQVSNHVTNSNKNTHLVILMMILLLLRPSNKKQKNSPLWLSKQKRMKHWLFMCVGGVPSTERFVFFLFLSLSSVY